MTYNEQTDYLTQLIELGMQSGLSHEAAKLDAQVAMHQHHQLERQRVAAEALRNKQRAYDYNRRARRHNMAHHGRPAPIISTYRTDSQHQQERFTHRDNVVLFTRGGAA